MVLTQYLAPLHPRAVVVAGYRLLQAEMETQAAAVVAAVTEILRLGLAGQGLQTKDMLVATAILMLILTVVAVEVVLDK